MESYKIALLYRSAYFGDYDYELSYNEHTNFTLLVVRGDCEGEDWPPTNISCLRASLRACFSSPFQNI